MNNKYELIIFTIGIKDYYERILDLINKEKVFFDKRLYWNHAAIKRDIYK